MKTYKFIEAAVYRAGTKKKEIYIGLYEHKRKIKAASKIGAYNKALRRKRIADEGWIAWNDIVVESK